MHDLTRLIFSLELVPGVEPITGRLCYSDGTWVEFVGWLELTQVLHAAVHAGEGDPAPEDDR